MRAEYSAYQVTIGSSGNGPYVGFDLSKDGHLVAVASSGLGELFFRKAQDPKDMWTGAFTAFDKRMDGDLRGPFAIENNALVIKASQPWYWYFCAGDLRVAPFRDPSSFCDESILKTVQMFPNN